MKYYLVLLFACQLWAGISPFSHVRVASYDQTGKPNEEIIDLSICIERKAIDDNPSDPNAREKYENIIKVWADAIYEMSNGGNYLGKIHFIDNGRFNTACDVFWAKCGVWPNAHVGGFVYHGVISVSDYYKDDYKKCDDFKCECNDYEGVNQKEDVEGMASTFAHESGHYIYGLDDEYGDAEINPQNGVVEVKADVASNRIILRNKGDNLAYFKAMVEPYMMNGQLVRFNTYGSTARLPNGLHGHPEGIDPTTFRPYAADRFRYASIDNVDVSNLDDGMLSFSLKNVFIRDSGVSPWGISLPANASSVPNSIMWDEGAFGSVGCGLSPQWQKWNFSSVFNVRRFSPQGMNFRKNGNSVSGWDLLISNPEYDEGFGAVKDGRRWFKSLIGREPKSSDVYNTTSFLVNYNENTSWWNLDDATWWNATYCTEAKEINIPYMKVELEGKTEEEYSKITRKYLEFDWIDNLEVETIVVIDRSASMASYNKMEQAKLAAQFVAEGFLSLDDKYDVSNVSVGIYAFNTEEKTIFKPKFNPNIYDINYAISSISPIGRTSLFDAIYDAIEGFQKPSSLKLLYVVSDGWDNESEKTKEDVINLYKSKNISIHTFAYGENADRKLLSAMANETGGSYYEQEEKLFLKIKDAVVTVLAGTYGNEQVFSNTLKSNVISSSIFIPQGSTRIRIYGAYRGNALNNPLKIENENGTALNAKTEIFSIDGMNYFITETGLSQLGINESEFVKIKNNSQYDIELRVLISENAPEYAVNVTPNPFGMYVWPQQGSFTASVQKNMSLLTGFSVVGKMIDPDGNEQYFELTDDGLHGDAQSGDGVYFGYMPAIKKNGTYQWEIFLSNKNGTAYSTRIGNSLPSSIVFNPVVDKNNFNFVRNGQFVVSNCCSGFSENDINEIQPLIKKNGYIPTEKKVGKFRIVKTDCEKSYVLKIQSSKLAMLERLEIYSPMNNSVPIYTAPIKSSLEVDFAYIPLDRDLVNPGNIISIYCSNPGDVVYSLLLLEKDYTSFAVGRFEIESDWSSVHTSLYNDNIRQSEGLKSLVSPAGWKIIESRAISTTDFEMIGDKMAMDVFVPASTQNKHWIGTIELWLNVPSSNKRMQIGLQQDLKPFLGGWLTYEFDMPNDVKSMFYEPHSDMHFEIVLNTADSVWIDNLRFAGKLRENTVNKYEPHCPGDEGCTSAKPLQLIVNNTIRIVPEGDFWFEVVGFPNDWTPASLHLGVSAEDGAELTGFLSFDESAIPLSDWYFQRGFVFERNRRYLFNVHNLGGRPYRINAWVDGQVLDVASNTPKTALPWVVCFY